VIDHCAYLRTIRYVHGDMSHLGAVFLGSIPVFGCDLSDLVACHVGETHIGAFAQQSLTNGTPDAARRTRHNTGPSRDPAHGNLSIMMKWQTKQARREYRACFMGL
jgi:hypothetical protein